MPSIAIFIKKGKHKKEQVKKTLIKQLLILEKEINFAAKNE